MTQADITQPSPGEPPAIALTRKAAPRPVIMVPRISIVVPTRNEEKSLTDLSRKIRKALEGHDEYELVFVDDGSDDGSWDVIRRLADADERIRGARLRRPSGVATALFAGIRKTRGNIVVTMGADLQDDPKDLGAFIEELEKGADVVVGARRTRHGSLARRALGRLWSLAARKLSGVALSDLGCGYAAFRGDVLRAIPIQGELVRFAPAIAASQGYHVTEVAIEHHPRKYPRTHAPFSRMGRGFVDLVGLVFVTHHKRRPLHVLALVGLLLGGFGALFAVVGTILSYAGYEALKGSLVPLGALGMVIGSQFFGVALVGELLAFQNHARFLGEEPPIRDEIR